MLIYHFKKWIADFMLNRDANVSKIAKYTDLSKSTIYRMKRRKIRK